LFSWLFGSQLAEAQNSLRESETRIQEMTSHNESLESKVSHA